MGIFRLVIKYFKQIYPLMVNILIASFFQPSLEIFKHIKIRLLKQIVFVSKIIKLKLHEKENTLLSRPTVTKYPQHGNT